MPRVHRSRTGSRAISGSASCRDHTRRCRCCRPRPSFASPIGASRTALRDALLTLAAKGLIEARKRAGTRVRPSERLEPARRAGAGMDGRDRARPRFRPRADRGAPGHRAGRRAARRQDGDLGRSRGDRSRLPCHVQRAGGRPRRLPRRRRAFPHRHPAGQPQSGVRQSRQHAGGGAQLLVPADHLGDRQLSAHAERAWRCAGGDPHAARRRRP